MFNIFLFVTIHCELVSVIFYVLQDWKNKLINVFMVVINFYWYAFSEGHKSFFWST